MFDVGHLSNKYLIKDKNGLSFTLDNDFLFSWDTLCSTFIWSQLYFALLPIFIENPGRYKIDPAICSSPPLPQLVQHWKHAIMRKLDLKKMHTHKRRRKKKKNFPKHDRKDRLSKIDVQENGSYNDTDKHCYSKWMCISFVNFFLFRYYKWQFSFTRYQCIKMHSHDSISHSSC